jgi:hypothetical protein
MKKFVFWLVAALVLSVSGFGYASDSDIQGCLVTTPTADDTYGYQMKNSAGTRLYSVTKGTGAIYTADGITAASGTFTTISHSRERAIPLPLTGFLFGDGTSISTTTTPGFEIDDLLPAIVWADGETSPVMITFRVPYDYSSGGAFRLICTESSSTTPNQVDFDVYVNRNGRASDASAEAQTPVALAGTTATPSVVTLTPTTDLTVIAAGDWITLRIWRDDTADGTGDLEVKGVDFYYTASQ